MYFMSQCLAMTALSMKFIFGARGEGEIIAFNPFQYNEAPEEKAF